MGGMPPGTLASPGPPQAPRPPLIGALITANSLRLLTARSGATDPVARHAFGWLLIFGGLDALLVKPVVQTGAAPWAVYIVGGAVFILVGAVGLWVEVSPAVLTAAPFLGVACVSLFTWTSEPMLGAATFYLIPIGFSGLFLGRGNLVGTVLTVIASFTVAVVVAPDAHLRGQLLLSVVVVSVSGAALVYGLRVRVTTLTRDLVTAATHDPLTGLLNRRGVAVVRAEGAPVSVVMFDLDHFKHLNDTQGHAAGDAALRRFAQALSACARADDVIGRVGGEEFVAILPGARADEAAVLAERVRTALGEDADAPVITVSAGVAATHPGGEALDDVMHRADAALLSAKRHGRDRVSVADAPLAPSEPRPVSGLADGWTVGMSWQAACRAAWSELRRGTRRVALPAAQVRRVAAGLILVGAALCSGVTQTVSSPYDRPEGLLALAAGMALLGVALLTVRALDVISPIVPLIGVMVPVSIAALADVHAGAALYLAWPLLFAAYFFPARMVVGAFLLGVVGLSVALALSAGREGTQWVAIAINSACALGLITALVFLVRVRIDHGHSLMTSHARTDALTGLANRRAFHEQAPLALAAGPGAAVLFDIDLFKRINDRHGHEVGDEVLRIFATALDRQARDGDVAARFGGEEFVAVLPRASAAEAEGFAERVCAAFRESALEAGHHVSASAGVADGGGGADDPGGVVDDLVARADVALYQAKRAGRACVRVWIPEPETTPGASASPGLPSG